MKLTINNNNFNLMEGDCLDRMKELDDNSVDAIITDPPYGMSFLQKNWDKALPSIDVWKECLRILKPGAFIAMCMTPRQDSLARAIVSLEEGGFETGFTSLYWTYATGFPKAHNISKAIDKKFGAERGVVGKSRHNKSTQRFYGDADSFVKGGGEDNFWNETAPATEQVKKFEGSYAGFQPKPAVEVIIVAMKPKTEPTFVGQALDNGKGVVWFDDCRIPYADIEDVEQRCSKPMKIQNRTGTFGQWGRYTETTDLKPQGRFPANLLVSDDILDDGKERNQGRWPDSFSRFFSLDAWVEKNLPFLITPKASKKEKTCDGTVECKHPTVKPIKLMSYLITMFSRPGDIVLDPFMGSGTTGVACVDMDRAFIGIELDEEYVKIATARIKNSVLPWDL